MGCCGLSEMERESRHRPVGQDVVFQSASAGVGLGAGDRTASRDNNRFWQGSGSESRHEQNGESKGNEVGDSMWYSHFVLCGLRIPARGPAGRASAQ